MSDKPTTTWSKANPNAGHRERLRQRFSKHGLENFQDYEVLELLLLYVARQKDMKPVAKRLIDHFVFFQAVLDASPSTLLKGERATVALYPDSANRLREKPGLDNPETGKIYPGKSVLIVNGPRCADGFVWWRVRALDGGEEGWTAEGKVGESWLLPEVRR